MCVLHILSNCHNVCFLFSINKSVNLNIVIYDNHDSRRTSCILCLAVHYNDHRWWLLLALITWSEHVICRRTSYPNLIHVVWHHFPQCGPVKSLSLKKHSCFYFQIFKAFSVTGANTPVIVLNEFNKFFLAVRFTRDDDGIVHEGLVKVYFIQLQV